MTKLIILGERIYQDGLNSVPAGLSRSDWTELASLGVFEPFARSPLAEQAVFTFGHDIYEFSRSSLDLGLTFTAIAHGMSLVALNQFQGQRAKNLIAKMIKGEKIGAICNAEPGAGSDIKGIKTELRRVGDHEFVLSGRKGLSTNLPVAETLLVSCRYESGIAAVLLDNKNNKYKSWEVDCIGLKTGVTGMVELSQVAVTDKDFLGDDTTGIEFFKLCFNLERYLLGKALSGVLDRILSWGVSEHHTTQHQFVQDKLVEIYRVNLQLKAMLEQVENQGLVAARSSLAVIKLMLATDVFDCFLRYFELLGGRAYLTGHIAERLMKDVISLKALGGTQELQKIVLFKQLLSLEHQRKKNLQAS